MNLAKKSTWHQSEDFSVSTYYTTALLTKWPGEILGVKKQQKYYNYQSKNKILTWSPLYLYFDELHDFFLMLFL